MRIDPTHKANFRTVTVKSRLVPLHLRPDPPLLASTQLLSAYNHAKNPSSFDMRASARESLAAHQRTHPGVGTDVDKIKAEKASWNELVNWVMSERRVEKLRTVEAERAKQLREVAKTESVLESGPREEDVCLKKKRRTSVPLPPCDSPNGSTQSIFGPAATSVTPKRGSSMAGLIRPSLATPQRPNSPRRLSDKRRTIYSGIGEYSPRGRTYTPPRILPSGDETAPFVANGSPAPTLQSFDFVSPLGPVKLGRLDSSGSDSHPPLGALQAVKEEPEDEKGWTIVQNRRSKRAESLPCRDKATEMGANGNDKEERQEGMTVDV